MPATVRWVTTPSCRDCAGPPELLRRSPCIGCEKLLREHPAKALPKAPAKKPAARRTADNERAERNARVVALRDAGLSYGKIARLMNIPRATVQSAEAAGRRGVPG